MILGNKAAESEDKSLDRDRYTFFKIKTIVAIIFNCGAPPRKIPRSHSGIIVILYRNGCDRDRLNCAIAFSSVNEDYYLLKKIKA